MIEQFVTEFYIKNKDFLERMEGMHSHEIYEVHNISSLLNKVANDYGLIKKTKQDDQYLQDYINDDVQALLKSSVERQLNSEHAGEVLIDLTADRIMSDLPKFQVGNDQKFIKSLDEFYQNLGVADKLNTYSLMDFDEDTFQIKGYKENALEVIKGTLAIHLHDKGTVLNPDIDFLRAKVEYFDSQLSEVQGDEILEYIKSKGLEERILLYALDKDYEIEGEKPIKWAIDNNLNINGKSAIEWAIENDLKIDGKLAFSYAVEDLGKKQGKLLEYAINNDLKIDGKSAFSYAVEDLGKKQGELLKYAIDNDLMIDDKPAFLYAVEDLGKNQEELLKYTIDNNIKIGGESAIKLAVGSDTEISGKPAFLYAVEDLGKNEEKILKHAIKNDITIAGKPALEWAFLNDRNIGGKPPMEYATSINANVAGMGLMDWVDKNVDRLLSEKAPKETVVGRHTEKLYKDSNLSVSKSVKIR